MSDSEDQRPDVPDDRDAPPAPAIPPWPAVFDRADLADLDELTGPGAPAATDPGGEAPAAAAPPADDPTAEVAATAPPAPPHDPTAEVPVTGPAGDDQPAAAADDGPGAARTTRRRVLAVGTLALAVGVAGGVGLFRRKPTPLIRRDVRVYAGLGVWIDTYDYVTTYAGPNPPVTPGTVDQLAARGVRTIYLQPVRNDSKTPNGIVDADLLASFLSRAHAKGIAVVGWSTPRFADVAFDLDRLVKIATFTHKGQRFDGIAVDIEDNETVPSPQTRSANLVELTRKLRAAVGPDVALGGVVMPPVQLDVVNPDFWPAFPWAELRGLYDVWLPMTYWTTRDADSGWRDGERYTAESVRLLREHLTDPEARVHPVGGIADKSTADQVAGYLRALQSTGSIGGSLYDVATTAEPIWQALVPLPGVLAPLPSTTIAGSVTATTTPAATAPPGATTAG